ncbi:MAG: hypothetical protein LBF28_01795 [Rickettsiales bacterium]|nr:hypothetical protein [Rickettsiales bacterium]
MANQNYQSEQYGGTCTGQNCNSNGTCSGRSTRYRCKSGYYGTVDASSAPICTQCPEADNIYTNSNLTLKARGTNVAGENATVDTCKLPAGIYYDISGTFMLEANTCGA